MAGNVTFYKNIIDNMQEGVMTLDLEGQITMFNDAAETMLGLTRERVIDKSFGQVFMVEMEANDEFSQAVFAAIYDSDAENKAVVLFKRPDGTEISLSMSTAYLRDRGKKEHSGVIVGFDDISTIVQYQENEKKLNRELTQAVVKAEETNAHLERVLKKVQLIRLAVTLLIIVGFTGGGYYIWNRELIPQTLLPKSEEIAIDQQLDGLSPHKVTSQFISSSVSLTGFVAPIEELNVLAPFEGKVKEQFFHYDQRVEKGALLLTMNTATLEKESREVQSKFFQAEQKHQELLNWQKGTDVAKARRSFTKATTALDNARKQVDVSEQLFKKDIIAESELESARTGFFNQTLDFKAAQEELDVVKGKGDKVYVDIARLELENARFALDEVKQKLTGASLRSPVEGVVLRSLDEKGSNKKIIVPGVSVNQGEKLLTIGNLDSFSIRAKADEVDIGKIQVGQEVIVRGDAFLDTFLQGQVTHVSSNAIGGTSDNPEFDVIISISEMTQAQVKRIRLGMTANVEITVYNKPSAILVPLNGVVISGGKKWVTIKDPQTGSLREVEVETGMTTMDSVEILDGLAIEDIIYY